MYIVTYNNYVNNMPYFNRQYREINKNEREVFKIV